MPYVNVKTNVEITEKERVKVAIGQLIEIIPSKDESKTMVCLQDKQDLYFRGTDEPCAIVETLVNKATNHTKDVEYCDALIQMLAAELKIPANRIYALVDEEDFWYAVRK